MPFEPRNLTSNPLFTQFWKSDAAGMAHRGLDEVTPEGVDGLVRYALDHNLDGTESATGEQKIDDDEKAVIKAILEHEHYGTFFEQDALPMLYEKFDIDPGAVHAAGVVTAPIDAGAIELPNRQTIIPEWQTKQIPYEQIGAIFAREFEIRADYFLDPSQTKTEKGKRVLGLLRDYAALLWVNGQQQNTREVADALLQSFYATPFATVFGATDYNGLGVGAAQSLVMGLDVNDVKTKYPKAYPSADTTYLSMDGAMESSMEFMDQFRQALGKDAAAAEYEAAPYLGYLIGDVSGHKKHGSLSEQRPFSTSGVNWGKVLFVGDAEIADLPPKKGFEFPIDCVDAYSRAIGCDPDRGERLEVRGKDGAALNVAKVIQTDADGKPVSWTADFTDADGNAVDPRDVTGVFVNRAGQVKGDSRTNGSYNMWWFGFCDRNTAQKLFKSRFGIPQLDRETIKIKAGNETIEVPKAAAQKLIDCDVPDLVANNTFIGFRYNDEPQTVTLKDGSRFQARVHERVLDYGPGATKIGSDMIAIHDSPERPLLGTVEVEDADGNLERYDAGQIAKITKDPATDQVTIVFTNDSKDDVVGTLKTSVRWEKAEDVNGQLVLKADSEGRPIRGELSFKMPDGSTRYVHADEIHEIAGEMKTEMRVSEYMAWISEQEGMFATDNSQGVVVSNGMRWVNRFELDERSGDQENPDWAKSDLKGINGELERVDGDKIVFVRARYGYNKDSDIKSTQFAGWMQIKDGQIVNEGFVSGEPDFGWGGDGPLNWSARSSFNPHVEPEMRLQLLINGVTDEDKLQALADAGNLPANWRSYKVAQETPTPIPDPVG